MIYLYRILQYVLKNRRSMIDFLRQIKIEADHSIFLKLQSKLRSKDSIEFKLVKLNKGQTLNFQYKSYSRIIILQNGKLKNIIKSILLSPPFILYKNFNQFICQQQCFFTILDQKQTQQYLLENQLIFEKTINILQKLVKCKFYYCKYPNNILNFVVFEQGQSITIKDNKQNHIYLCIQGIIIIEKTYYTSKGKSNTTVTINCSKNYNLVGIQSLFINKCLYNIKSISKRTVTIRIKVELIQKLIPILEYNKLKYEYQLILDKIKMFEDSLGIRNQNIEAFCMRTAEEIHLLRVKQDKKNMIRLLTEDNLSQNKKKQKEGYSEYMNYFFNQSKQKLQFKLITNGLKNIRPENYISKTDSNQNTLRIRLKNYKIDNSFNDNHSSGFQYNKTIMNRIKIRKKGSKN